MSQCVVMAIDPSRDEILESTHGPTLTPETVTLKVHQPEPETDNGFAMPEFNDQLLAKMLANLAANGITLGDLAGSEQQGSREGALEHTPSIMNIQLVESDRLNA
jgi:hypothetical protein